MKMAHPLAAFAAGFVLFLSASPLHGQVEGEGGQAGPDLAPAGPAAQPSIAALRISGEDNGIDLDGRLDEDAWSRAVPVSDFTQQEPVEGGEPSERTEVRITYDADNLYIGAMIFDDPEGILAYQRERDAQLGTDDRFIWIIDTFLDGRTGYMFEINAAGLMGDGLLGGVGVAEEEEEVVVEVEVEGVAVAAVAVVVGSV